MNVRVVNRSSRTIKVSAKTFVTYLCRGGDISFIVDVEEAFAIGTIRNDTQAIYQYKSRDYLTVEVFDSGSPMGRKIVNMRQGFAPIG
jgi:hypothetical protein